MKLNHTTAMRSLALFFFAALILMPVHLLAGSKPRVAVAKFETKVRKAHAKLGSTMSDLLIDALVNTGRFNVLERDVLDELRQEQDLTLSGEVDATTGAEYGKLIGAQYLIVGAVTKFEEKKSGGGIGGLVSKKILGGVAWYTSELGITVRVIDATTSEIITSEKIKKKKKSVGLAALTGILGNPVAGGLYKSASMQDALEEAITDAAKIIGAKIPSEVDENAAQSTHIKIALANITFGTLRSFTSMIEKVDGVDNLKKNFTGGNGVVSLMFDGTAEDLADAIYTAKTDDLDFEIIGMTDRKIEIAMK